MLISLFGLSLQRPQHDLVKPHVHLHFLRRQRKPADRQFTRQHFVNDHSQRVDVGTVVNGVCSLHLFRRHVMRRPHDLPRAGQ